MDLTLIIRNPKRAVIELHGDLLMAPVDVDVGVGGHLQLHAHTLFDDHETGSEHFFSVIVRVINRELIVAAELDPTAIVGYSERVMGVERIGVNRFRDVVDRVSFGETVDIIAREKFVGRCPIGFAMADRLDVSMILVCEIVKSNMDRCRAS